MITLDNKLEVFSRLVLDKARVAYQEAMQEMDRQHAARRAEKTAELERQGKRYSQEMAKAAEQERRRILSRAKGQAHRNILVKKEELFHQLKERIIQEIGKYCETPEYPKFLEERMNLYREDLRMLRGELEVACRPADADLAASLIKKMGMDNPVHIVTDDEILGGLTLTDRENGVKVTMTIDAVLEENSVYLGSLIHGLFEEAGETNE